MYDPKRRLTSSDKLKAVGLGEDTAARVVSRAGPGRAESAVGWVQAVLPHMLVPMRIGEEGKMVPAGDKPAALRELLRKILAPNANMSSTEVQGMFDQAGIHSPGVPFTSLRSFLSGALTALIDLERGHKGR